MRAADVSQLPVVDGDRIVGLVDESDMLGAVLEGSARAFELPVKEVMVTRLETISGDAPIRELIPLFRRDRESHDRKARVLDSRTPLAGKWKVGERTAQKH